MRRALLDINVILALFDAKHVHHGRARQWWRGNSGHGWATCPLTENGFLRIVSQKAYASPIPLPDALAYLRQVAKPPLHVFWPDDISLLDTAVIDHGRLLGPRQLTDSYLLALAVKHGGRLVTLDRGISVTTARGGEAEHLVEL